MNWKRYKTVFHPIVAMVLMVIICYFILISLETSPRTSDFDTTLFYAIAGICFLSALFMAIRTQWKDWTLLGAGLFGHFLAISVVYVVYVWYGTHDVTFLAQESIYLARTMLIVSGLMVLAGILWEWARDYPKVEHFLRRSVAKVSGSFGRLAGKIKN